MILIIKVNNFVFISVPVNQNRFVYLFVAIINDNDFLRYNWDVYGSSMKCTFCSVCSHLIFIKDLLFIPKGVIATRI